MTIIKIKENLEIKGCCDCPFLVSCGECVDDVVCGIYLLKHDNYVNPAMDETKCTDDDGLALLSRPDNCPIISIEDGSE